MHESPPASMPVVAPHYALPPYRYRDCPMLVVALGTGPGVTRALVPEPLAPLDDAMFVAFGLMNNDVLGPTREAFVVVPASHEGATGNYCVLLYLESDACITSGREIWGWPKKQARIEVRAAGERPEAIVTRGGELIRARLDAMEPARPEDLPLSPTWFNLKLIPSVVAGRPPEVHQITATTFRDVRVSDVRRGAASLTIGSTDEDPLQRLIRSPRALGAFTARLDFDLLHGEILHDFLQPAGTASRAAEPVGV